MNPQAADPKLRRSLDALARLGDVAAVRSRNLSRTHRERLVANGYLREVLQGWYVPVRGDLPADPARAWYDQFWAFCAGYLDSRFGTAWCLAPEHAIAVHTGDWTVPGQLVVRTARGGNKPLTLPHGTGLLDLRLQPPADRVEVRALGIRIMELESALIASPIASYRSHPRHLHAALWLLDDVEVLTARLIEGRHSKVAGRLAGALRQIGRPALADALSAGLRTAGIAISETEPFARAPRPTGRDPSPYPNRQSLRRRWAAMRGPVLEAWPGSSGAEQPARPRGGGPAEDPATAFAQEHCTWQAQLLASSASAGDVCAEYLGHYRRRSRYRRGRAHTPPRHEAMRDLLPVLFELLGEEPDARVAAVLGHWLLTLLAPFEHGNRRLALALSQQLLTTAGQASSPRGGPAGCPADPADGALGAAPAADYEAALRSAWIEDDPRALTRLLAGRRA